jgi:Uma2 family endonuclease
MNTPATMTADELLHLDMPNKRTELIGGRLVVREPAGYQHGDVTIRITRLIANYVDAHDLGRVFAAETGFTLARNPDTVRAADVAFISHSRLPEPPPSGFAKMAPDLVVEVLSPDDRPGKVLAKVADWLRGGSRLIWVIDPMHRRARVYRADGSESHVSADGALEGESVLPGFSCLLSAILPSANF